MSGRSSKRKGASGERELCKLLSDALGYPVQRTLNQARDGGADCIDVPGYAIEVKRAERFRSEWIEQAERQARELGRVPVLAWRTNRKPWRVMVMHELGDFAARVLSNESGAGISHPNVFLATEKK